MVEKMKLRVNGENLNVGIYNHLNNELNLGTLIINFDVITLSFEVSTFDPSITDKGITYDLYLETDDDDEFDFSQLTFDRINGEIWIEEKPDEITDFKFIINLNDEEKEYSLVLI